MIDTTYRLIHELKNLTQKDAELYTQRNKNLIVKDVRQRTVGTLFGEITYSRRRYFDMLTQRYRYLLDEWLGIDRNFYVPPAERQKALTNFLGMRSYQNIAAYTYQGQVCKQTISNYIRHHPFATRQPVVPLTNVDTLFIGVDSIYVRANPQSRIFLKTSSKYVHKNEVEIKSFVFFTGSEKGQLINRTLNFGVQEPRTKPPSARQLIDFLQRDLAKYGTYKKLVIVADGAPGIKRLARHLYATYVNDKYHVNKRLRDLFPRRAGELYASAYAMLHDPKTSDSELSKYLSAMAQQYHGGKLTLTRQTAISYIVANRKSYLLGHELGAISPVECVQAHTIGKHLKGERRGGGGAALNQIIMMIQLTANARHLLA